MLMGNSGKKPRSGAKTGMIILCVVLAVILTAMIVFTAFVESLMNRINRDVSNETLSSSEIEEILKEEQAAGTGPSVHEDEIDFGNAPAGIVVGEGIINILLIGQDRRPGEGRQRSDAMILCTINPNAKTLTMTSFMRDVYVKIPGYRNNKLNACYAIGGMELLDACLEQNFGVHVDANVEVDFSGFMKLIDMVGGIELELRADEANYLNARGNWDVAENEGWALKAGRNKMNGSQALAFSRIRDIGMDFERTERQRKVIAALIDTFKEMSLPEMLKILEEAVSFITTDMSNKEITGCVMDMFPLLRGLTIKTQRVPMDGTYKFGNVNGVGDSIIIDFETNRKMLADTLTG